MVDMGRTWDIQPIEEGIEMTHHKMSLDMKLDEILRQLEAGANNLKVFGTFKNPIPKAREMYDTVMHHMSCTLIEGAKLAEMLKGGSDNGDK